MGVSIILHGMVLQMRWARGIKQTASISTHVLNIQLTARLAPAAKSSQELNVISEKLARVSPSDALPERALQKETPHGEIAPQMPSRGSAADVFGPWYYTSRYLHRRPSPLKPIWPQYPAGTEGLTGHVLLLLYIGYDGSVDKYEIVESEPKGIFDEAVIEAFATARYAPGRITGYAVRSQLLVEVTYEPTKSPLSVLTTPTDESSSLSGSHPPPSAP